MKLGNEMSKTPRTDAEYERLAFGQEAEPDNGLSLKDNLFFEMRNFARQLETELATVQASHDNQVKLRRVLMDRPDLKERAVLVERLEAELTAKTEELENAHKIFKRLEVYVKKENAEYCALLRTARANAFNEAYKLAHSVLTCEVEGKQFYIGAAARECLEKLQDKADRIRKGEEK